MPRSGSQFSKHRLVDFGELPRGEIPKELEVAPYSKLNTLPNGAKVYLEEYPGTNSTVSLYVKAGSRYETIESSGSSHLLWRALLAGNGEKSQADIELEFARIGAKLQVTADREWLGFHATVDGEFAVDAAQLLCGHILSEKISDQAVESQKQTLLHNIFNVSRDQHLQTIELLFATSFRDHMVGQPLHGNRDVVPSLTPEHVREHRDRTFAGKNSLLIVSGNLASAEKAAAVAAEKLGALPAAPRLPTPNTDRPFSTTSSMLCRDDEMANVNTAVSYVGPGMEHPDTFKYKFFQEILGDFNARENGASHLNHGGLSYNYLHRYLGSAPGVGLQLNNHLVFSDFSVFTAYTHGNEVYTKQMVAIVPYILGQAAKNLNVVEVLRARAKIFNKLLARNGTVHTNEGIARELAYLDRRIDRSESARRFSALSCERLLAKFAYDRFFDGDPSVVTWGDVHHFMHQGYYEQFITKASKGSWLSIY